MIAPIAVLDACVLYPVVVRDLLLTLATNAVFQPRWSGEILDEMRRNVLADHADIDPTQFDIKLLGAMARRFPNALVTGFEHLIASMDNDPKDRHVAAAAVHARASMLITDNLRDFGGSALSRNGVRVMTPAEMVTDLLDNDPDVFRVAIEQMAARKQHPPMTADEILDALARHQSFGALRQAMGDAI